MIPSKQLCTSRPNSLRLGFFASRDLADASYAVVLADARPAAWLALASSAVVLVDARSAELLAPASSAVVLADARTRTPC